MAFLGHAYGGPFKEGVLCSDDYENFANISCMHHMLAERGCVCLSKILDLFLVLVAKGTQEVLGTRCATRCLGLDDYMLLQRMSCGLYCRHCEYGCC